MKINRTFIFIIIFILAVAPFFWLKSDLINIGGDSSGAYFYDPISFIKNYAVYNINPWNVNSEITGFFLIPFSGLLGTVLFIVNTPHNLINFFNSFMLTTAFIAIYGSIYAILKDSDDKFQKQYAMTAGAIGGLFYIFSPNMTNWDKPLITFTHFMLDPLVFFLIYKYLRTQNVFYGLIILLITFIFAHNFSFIGAPTLFSFYPLIFLYIILSHYLIKKIKFNLKHIFLLFLLFLGIHSFQLIPQVVLIFSPKSELAERVFSQGAFNYVDYFYRIANGVRVVDNFLALPQSTMPFASTYFIFPFLIIVSLFQKVKNKSESILRIHFIIFLSLFLLLLFFTSAKFTGLGLRTYAYLFKIPGFGMFRHFTGQFMTSYIFFYSIVVGFSIYTISRQIHKKIIFYLSIVIFFVLFLRGWPLLNGSMLYLPVLQTKITTPFKMPQGFVDALHYILNIKTDSKIIAFPLNDFGYSLFAGEKEGLYIGTSLIGPMTLKPDFQASGDLGPFGNQFLQASNIKDIPTIENIFAYLNIHDIFWEKNSKIYAENFPDFPYSSTKQYLPTTVSFYSSFLDALPLSQKKSFGKSLQVLHIDDEFTLPSIYVSGKPVYSKNIYDTINFSFKRGNQPSVVLPYEAHNSAIRNGYYQAEYANQFAALDDNLQFHTAEPEVTWKPGSVIFPFVVRKEEMTLSKLRDIEKLNMSYLFLAKRIEELDKWGKKIPLHAHKSLLVWEKYNSWESQLNLYNKYANNLIEFIKLYPPNDKNAQKIIAEEQFEQHRLRLYKIINAKDFSQNEKDFLLKLNNTLFGNLIKKLQIQQISFLKHYNLRLPKDSDTTYNIVLSRTQWPSIYSTLKIDDRELTGTIGSNGEINYGKLQISPEKDYKIQLDSTPYNLANNYSWEGYQTLQDSINGENITFSTLEDLTYKPIVRKLPVLPKTNQYILSFEYKTDNLPLFTRLFYKRINNNGILEESDFSQRLISSNVWRQYQTVFTVRTNTKSTGIEFTSNPKNGPSQLDIRNFILTPVEHPLLVFQDIEETHNSLPKITYQRINPVKYKINIENATKPYILTFLKSYNTKWKLYYAGTNLGHIRVDKEYFNNLISEGDHKNILLDKNTFETWRMSEIASNNHWLANGYANAWVISPKEIHSNNYELILEFEGQRQFYIGSFITIIAVIITLITLFFFIIKMIIHLRR